MARPYAGLRRAPGGIFGDDEHALAHHVPPLITPVKTNSLFAGWMLPAGFACALRASPQSAANSAAPRGSAKLPSEANGHKLTKLGALRGAPPTRF